MKRLALFAVLLAWSAVASAVIYKWTDAQGKVQYGDRPPDGVHAELVELLGVHNSRNSTATPAPAPPASTGARAPTDAKDDTAKQQVADDVAETRDKQCADAQERYKKLIEGRRLYKQGADGERQYLTSEEIDNERLNAKREVDSVCNSPT